MSSIEDLRIRQLDDALKPFEALRRRPPPPTGWIRTIREALGMSLRQLGRRSGLSKTSVTSAEQSEADGKIQLDTMRRLADAMQCDLVYALVPRDSLRSTLITQAERISYGLVDRVSESMELEAQDIPYSERTRQSTDLAAETLRNRGRSFWDV